MSKHSHFKFTEDDLSHIFHSPGKTALLVAVFVTIIFCAVILIQSDFKNQKNSVQILNQAEQTQGDNQIVRAENYEKEVKEILNQHLVMRTQDNFKRPESCQNLVNQTAEKVLNLILPVDYKEFHLKLVVLLDKENQNCIEQNEIVKSELNGEWDELLDNYGWLYQNSKHN